MGRQEAFEKGMVPLLLEECNTIGRPWLNPRTPSACWYGRCLCKLSAAQPCVVCWLIHTNPDPPSPLTCIVAVNTLKSLLLSLPSQPSHNLPLFVSFHLLKLGSLIPSFPALNMSHSDLFFFLFTEVQLLCNII